MKTLVVFLLVALTLQASLTPSTAFRPVDFQHCFPLLLTLKRPIVFSVSCLLLPSDIQRSFSPGSPVFFFDLRVLLCHFFLVATSLSLSCSSADLLSIWLCFSTVLQCFLIFWLTVFLQVQWPWWTKRGTGFRLSLKDGASDWLCCHQAEIYPLPSQK